MKIFQQSRSLSNSFFEESVSEQLFQRHNWHTGESDSQFGVITENVSSFIMSTFDYGSLTTRLLEHLVQRHLRQFSIHKIPVSDSEN